MVRAQSYITINFAGQVQGILGPDDFKAEVTAALADVPLGVPSFDLTHDDVFWQIITFQFIHYSYAATIVVQARTDYDSVDDVVAIVTATVANVAGQAPATFQGQVTNVPALVPIGSQPAPASPGLLGWLGQALGLDGLGSTIQNDLSFAFVSIFVLLLVIVFVIGYGPNVKKLSTISL